MAVTWITEVPEEERWWTPVHVELLKAGCSPEWGMLKHLQMLCLLPWEGSFLGQASITPVLYLFSGDESYLYFEFLITSKDNTALWPFVALLVIPKLFFL